MAPTSICDIPEELLLHIFNYLDSPAPSELKSRHEPNLHLTSSSNPPALKNISGTSKLWRRIALPLLFRNARLRLDSALPPIWTCPTCSGRGVQALTEAQQYHAEMARRTTLNYDTSQPSSTSEDRASHELDENATVLSALAFYHHIQSFLDFVQHHCLEGVVTSFVLLTTQLLAHNLNDYRFPHEDRKMDWRYAGAAALWRQLFDDLNPRRVAILAPPMDLAYLINAAIDTFGDWAFGDMEYHLLELRQENAANLCAAPNKSPTPYFTIQPHPKGHPGIAPSSVLHSRPWTHIALNEGSFLKAYGTYEFFERGPPSCVYSIKSAIVPRWVRGATHAHPPYVPTIRSFTYTAIFPFATHINFREILSSLDELDLQLAPLPDSGILDDKGRVGRAELQDCWQEVFSAYDSLGVGLATRGGGWRHVRRFVCRDVQIKGIRRELDDLFIGMCLPRWVEEEDGVFTSEGDEGVGRSEDG